MTTDLSTFGTRELRIAAELLNAYAAGGKAFRWLSDGLQVWINVESGYVFLCDEGYNVGVMDGGELRQFHTCSECGQEGFEDEMREGGDACCAAYLDALL